MNRKGNGLDGSMKGIAIAAVCLALTASCSLNTNFVYKPTAPAAAGPKVPVKIAVLPFKDGTENFTRIGQPVFTAPVLRYNLAKAGNSDMITALPPEFWSKSLAEELTTSGRFEGVRFLYDKSEQAGEEVFIEGTLTKADLNLGSSGDPHEFVLALRAIGRADGRTKWEGAYRRAWKFSDRIYTECGGFDFQCTIDGQHASINAAMQGIFDEAGADLARALGPLAGSGAGAGAKPPGAPSADPVGGSVDETIESILKGK